MDRLGRAVRLALMLATVACAGLSAAKAQLFQAAFTGRFELSDSVHVDEIDATSKQHLERARAFVVNRQWDEAIETYRQVMESQGGRVVLAEPGWYLNARDYCQLQLSRLPEEALALYRQRVDGLARRWLDDGMAGRLSEPLERIVEQVFCSSHGDDALLALGELALERGDLDGARAFWDRLLERPPVDVSTADFERVTEAARVQPDERLLLQRSYEPDVRRPGAYWRLRTSGGPSSSDAELQQLARLFRELGISSARLAYPATDIPLAEVRARHVLLAILEGDSGPARAAIDEFRRQYPIARGRLGGRETVYIDALESLYAESIDWPRRDDSADWPTFAGATSRNKIARGVIDLPRPVWELQLPGVAATDVAVPVRRVAEDRERLLSYYPVVVGSLVLMNNQHDIVALDLKTGRPAWPLSDAQQTTWERARIFHYDEPGSSASAGRLRQGVPRFTLTVHDRKLYARMGNPVTSSVNDGRTFGTQGFLICLDLAREGSAVWDSRQTAPLDDKWAYEGAPVCAGTSLYVGLRRGDVRPQAHVACLDALTGKQRWRRLICSAETPAQGQEEITHNLLTLHAGTLYYNTNLGAVAAIDAASGRIKWLRRYQRAKGGELSKRAAHFFRDLNPAVYDRGMLYVAPSDFPGLMAIEAETGALAWDTWTTSHAEDAVHLLGVSGGHLFATGDRIWGFNAVSGKVVAPFPWPVDRPGGFGRGVLTDQLFYWPMRDRIHVVSTSSGQETRNEIRLGDEKAPLSGGSLIISNKHLLVVASQTITGYALEPVATPAAVPGGKAAGSQDENAEPAGGRRPEQSPKQP